MCIQQLLKGKPLLLQGVMVTSSYCLAWQGEWVSWELQWLPLHRRGHWNPPRQPNTPPQAVLASCRPPTQVTMKSIKQGLGCLEQATASKCDPYLPKALTSNSLILHVTHIPIWLSSMSWCQLSASALAGQMSGEDSWETSLSPS